MWINKIKTAVLLASLSGLFLFIGHLFGGTTGLHIALVLGLLFNGLAYFFSEQIVLSMYNAHPLDTIKYAWIHDMVRELAHTMKLPMPKLWIINTPMANAFATGRNPHHASVAVTTGILHILNKDELRGVLAHELSHIKNRDILVGTVAATLATAIGYLAQMMQWAALWGNYNTDDKKKNGNPFFMLFVAILMPIAASLIQLAISRSREYLADETGAHACKDPWALASALEKLQAHIPHAHMRNDDTQHAGTAALFIVYPFTADGWISLFSTHPPMKQRIAKLRSMKKCF